MTEAVGPWAAALRAKRVQWERDVPLNDIISIINAEGLLGHYCYEDIKAKENMIEKRRTLVDHFLTKDEWCIARLDAIVQDQGGFVHLKLDVPPAPALSPQINTGEHGEATDSHDSLPGRNTMLTSGAMAAASNPTHPPSPNQPAVPPPSPPAAGPLLTTDRQTNRSHVITHPADIIEALKNQVDPRWRHFGNFLRFDSALMNIIEKDNRGSSDCMLELVTRWVREDDGTGQLPRTWETVVKAVKGSASEHARLAGELAREYLK